MKEGDKAAIGLGVVGIIGVVGFSIWVMGKKFDDEQYSVKCREQVANRLTIVNGKEWGDVRTEIMTVVRTQDFLRAGDYGPSYLYRLIELSSGTMLLQHLGTSQPLNAHADTLNTRADRGAHVGDQWESTLGKRVDTYHYTIETEEVLIDTRPHVDSK